MDIFPCYRIQVMSRERVHVEITDGASSDPKRFHYDWPGGKNNDYVQGLCQKAQVGELSPQEVKDLGEALFQMLFTEGARQKFLEIYDGLGQHQQWPLHIELTIDEKALPDLARLPWEFLRLPWSEQRSALWLSSNPNLCFLRRPLQHGEPPVLHLRPSEKLRIAVIIADALPDQPVYSLPIVELLRDLTHRASGRIETLEVLAEATHKNIIRKLRPLRPHLVHFIGHAQFTEQMRAKVALIDEIPTGMPEWISAEDFGELFEPMQSTLKAVVLQACESAAGSYTSAFASVAAHVLSHHIPAVVAMQYEISNMTATCFAQALYELLLRGVSIDQAVQEARYAISQEATPSDQGSYYGYFATPVLFRYANDRQLWKGTPFSSFEEMTIDHYYRCVDEYRVALGKAADTFDKESVIAHDRCAQYQAVLAQLQKALSDLYGTLDHPARSRKRMPYAELFKVKKTQRQVQELHRSMDTFCPLCPPPFHPLNAAYYQQRVSIGSTLRGVERDLSSIKEGLRFYLDHSLKYSSSENSSA